VHIGERKAEKPKITLLYYDETSVEERVVDDLEGLIPDKQRQKGVTWINVDGLHEIEILSQFGRVYGLHPLTLEDILNTDQRPKHEDFEEYLFIVLKMLEPNHDREPSHAEQLSLVLGNHFVLTFLERERDVFESIKQRIRADKGRIRKEGADYLAYTLVDTTVDHYFLLLEEFEERIEGLEASLLEGTDANVLPLIQRMRRDLIFLRRSVWPLREIINGLQRGGSCLVSDPTQVYLRDVYDHTIQLLDTIESLRDLVSGILELHLSTVGNRMNSVMKVLTIIATIFIPLTFVAGVYGMNFRHMPELEWTWAYPAVLVLMAGSGLLMLLFFKKKRWL
jgi:magnesium transporter